MKKGLFSVLLFILIFRISLADEGMWLPFLLGELNMEKMQEMGLKLSEEDIYSVNNSSLKDAIVIFGGGCTGEIISDKGLLLTNMHCGYRRIQSHTTIENDYLKNGFWAGSLEEELPNPGLTVKFLIRVEDVSERVNNQFTDEMTEAERSAVLKELSAQIEEDAVEGTHYDAVLKSYYGGNQYYVLVYETYRDVRLVGNPPVSIGDFGSLTDNWMWPRHKADFSLFRVYTAPDGKPAEYSPDNVPLKPKHHLPVSLKGVKPGDFSMILGNPGSTDRFLTAYGIKELMDISHPNRIKIRGAKLKILNETMEISPEYRIMYAAKYKGASNYWKYSVAQMAGFKRIDLLSKRKELEKEFVQWVLRDQQRKEEYGSVIEMIKNAYKNRAEYKNVSQYILETMIIGPEFMRIAGSVGQLNQELNKGLFKKDKDKINELIQSLSGYGKSYFRDYHKPTDKKVTLALLKIYKEDIDPKYHPEHLKKGVAEYGSLENYVDHIFSTSIFINKEKFFEFIEDPDKKVLSSDPAFLLANSVYDTYGKIYSMSNQYDEQLAKAHRLFVKGVMEMNTDKNFYPDANFTMRLTYGKVGGYIPRDAVYYKHYTTLEGVMEKEDPDNYEFIVPEKLKKLYYEKDYGNYAYGDEMHVCFITDNDITGGNSGSPVLNGKGELIGLAFDSNWEGMTGDIEFEEEMQKTVCTDIKYIVWLIDKFAEADNIIEELDFVK